MTKSHSDSNMLRLKLGLKAADKKRWIKYYSSQFFRLNALGYLHGSLRKLFGRLLRN